MSRSGSVRRRVPRTRFRPTVEPLERRNLLAAGPTPFGPPLLFEHHDNDTLNQAQLLATPAAGDVVYLQGLIGNSSAGNADVDWFSFTLDTASQVNLAIFDPNTNEARPTILSLYNSVPFDFFDPEALFGHRQIEQTEGVFERLLPAGTYLAAVSGINNRYFHPFVADSGSAGEPGEYQVRFSATALDIDPSQGPTLLGSDPAPGAILSHSPFVLRLTFDKEVVPDSLIPDETVILMYHPNGEWGDGNEQWVSLSAVNFSSAAKEIQVLPAAPLQPGFYRLVLAGDMDQHFSTIYDPDGVSIGTSEFFPNGRDFVLDFEVAGIENETPGVSDDTPDGARDLGVLGHGSMLERAGAIGDDPKDPVPFNPSDVDLYRFEITGPGQYALTAEVFARRMGSPLNSGLSLFRRNDSGQWLDLLAGNDDTLNDLTSSDGNSVPLFADSALFVGLTAGEYFLAVSSRKNVPNPNRDDLPGVDGIFDPMVPYSGSAGASTGAYVLHVLLQRDDKAPEVVDVNIEEGSTLDAAPVQVAVRFSESVNVQELAYRAYERQGAGDLAPVTIVAADGTVYHPRFQSFDEAAKRATFLLLDRLPDGKYELRLSGSLGLTDFASNPLVGNDPSGDYVVTFAVQAGVASSTDLGVLFPRELEAGVPLTRTPGQTDPAGDHYRFEIVQSQSYFFQFLGTDNSPGLEISLTDAAGDAIETALQHGGTSRLAFLQPGVYELHVTGWTPAEAADIQYTMEIKLGGSMENPPPLTVGPAPIFRLRLVVDPPVGPATPPSSSNTPPQSNILPTSVVATPSVDINSGVRTGNVFQSLGAGPLGGLATRGDPSTTPTGERLQLAGSTTTGIDGVLFVTASEAQVEASIGVIVTAGFTGAASPEWSETISLFAQTWFGSFDVSAFAGVWKAFLNAFMTRATEVREEAPVDMPQSFHVETRDNGASAWICALAIAGWFGAPALRVGKSREKTLPARTSLVHSESHSWDR